MNCGRIKLDSRNRRCAYQIHRALGYPEQRHDVTVAASERASELADKTVPGRQFMLHIFQLGRTVLLLCRVSYCVTRDGKNGNYAQQSFYLLAIS